MLIIPVGKRVDWKRPPVVTISLILINCFVYFFLQYGSEQQDQKAVEYYYSTELPAVEFSHYLTFLKIKSPEEASKFQQVMVIKNANALYFMEIDYAFMSALRDEEIITPQIPEFSNWKAQRSKYESMRSFTNLYKFKRYDPDFLTMLTSAFMHANVGHLFGNMVFLFLVGFLVESVIGKVFFLTNYLFSALAAIVVYLLTSNGSSLLGASGAVSGLMGIYTVIFGLRKIDLFYSFGFYFDRIRAPAILLLPIWLGTELYQYFYDKDSHIAYMAHFGGLICGATMGALYLGQKRALVEDNHAKAESQIVDKEIFEQGMDYLGKLEFKKALHVFKKLLEKHPDNINLIRLTYRAAKNDPSSEDYHRSALKFLSLPSKDTTVFDQKHSIFLEYMNCAKPAPKLNHEITVKLAKEFSAHSHSDDAEKLANWLQNNSPTHSELPEILLALARGFYRENRKEKFAEVINKIIQQYPNTTAAASATEMLRVG